MRQLLFTVALIGGTGLFVDAQGPAPVTLVAGQVVADSDGRPLAGVHVSVRPAEGPSATVLTDPLGRFEVMLASAPSYDYILRKAGYFPLRAAGSPTQDELRLEEGAVITGHVVDDGGEPVLQATVTAAERNGSSPQTALTDDRGEYRLFVHPGNELLVSVTTSGLESARMVGAGQIRIEAPTHTLFYPGTDVVDRAEMLVLEPGEVRTGIDLVIATERAVRQPFRGLESVPSAIGIVADRDARSDGTAVIHGRVLDSFGRALPNSLVLLASERPGALTRMTRADEAGTFEFRAVPAGPMRVIGSKPGHSPDEARPIIAASPDTPSQVELRLVPWGAMGGRVLNEFGEPMQGARVQIMRTRFTAGRRTLVVAGTLTPETDDRGEFRVYGLEPGSYIVSAQVGDVAAGDADGYPVSYYPGGSSPASATALTIGAGQNLIAIDISLSRTTTYRVTGRLVTPSNQPSTITSVQLWPSQKSRATISVPLAAPVDGNGQFEFSNVADGDYVLQAYRGRLNAMTEGEFGAVAVTVSGSDVTDLTLPTSAGSRITGTIVIDAQDPGRQPSRANIEISPVPGDLDLAPAANWATAGVGPDWRFSFAGVSGPRRLVPTQLPVGWAVKTVRVNGVDLGDRPVLFGSDDQSLAEVEIVLTDRPSELQGSIVGPATGATAGTSVVVFSPERERWYPMTRYVRRVAARADGTFSISGLPPGGYYVATLVGSGGDDWQDPDALEALISRATFVMIDEGQRAMVRISSQ